MEYSSVITASEKTLQVFWSFGIILVGELANLIDRGRAERVEFYSCVFHRQGRPLQDYSRAWGTARTKAGVPKRLLYDSRRTTAGTMDRAGVPHSVAKQIIGHKTDGMYNRYQIVDEQGMREGMTQSENHLANTNETYLGHNEVNRN
jgi:hypothetical protein